MEKKPERIKVFSRKSALKNSPKLQKKIKMQGNILKLINFFKKR